MRLDLSHCFNNFQAHQQSLYYIRGLRMSVLIETSFGDITIDLQTEKFPTATYNFLKLCKMKHYNNALFMKVQKDFVTEINTKKPTTIWNQLGQNKPFFKDEIDLQAKVHSLGLVGTSNRGSNKNNSQFFITLTKSHLSSLNGKHTVFGKVQEGFDVLKKINQTYVNQKNRPQMNIRILHTFVLDDPFEDPPGLKIPQSPVMEKDSQRLEAIEHLEMLQKYSSEKDILDATRKQKAKKQAITLQMIGELPDANVKPPQNMLFVCKLNPITQQRDLQIIFSRFGPIKSVEVVRDWKTGQSLQYAFIQFESQKSCQEAYLKMDNVLIDDRRIKVDFSQSVSKLMPKMRGNQAKTYKGGENRTRVKQLVPTSNKDKVNYGDKKYDIVAKDTKVYKRNEDRKQKKSKRKHSDSQSQQKRRSISSDSSYERQKREKKRLKKQKKERKQKKSKRKESNSQKSSVSDRSRSKQRNFKNKK